MNLFVIITERALKSIEAAVAAKASQQKKVLTPLYQCIAVCCNMLQCVAVCCSVLQCGAVCCHMW